MYVIKYQLKDDPLETIHQSPRLFSPERASYLVEEANREFRRAYHWAEPTRRSEEL